VLTTTARQEPTIDLTIESLHKAGWDDVVVVEDKTDNNLVITWIKAIEQIIKTEYDYCLIIQDDVLLYKHTKQYLEITLPKFDIASLFTIKKENLTIGWHSISIRYGALAYVLTKKACNIIVSELKQNLYENAKKDHDPENFVFYHDNQLFSWNNISKIKPNHLPSYTWNIIPKWKHIDFHVDFAAKRNQLTTVLHHPNLCHHIGKKSTIGNVYPEYPNSFKENDSALQFCSKMKLL
jgi:hypothetical protein